MTHATTPYQPWGIAKNPRHRLDLAEALRRLDEEQVYFDTMVLSSCARTDLTPLLRTAFAGRLHIADGVQAELKWGITRKGIGRLATIFDPPVWFKVDRITDSEERLWVPDLQTQWALNKDLAFDKWIDKGEAETLVLARQTHWIFVTNDTRALDYDGLDGFLVRSMAYLFVKLVRDGLIERQAMWDAYLLMCQAYNLYPIWCDELTLDEDGKAIFFAVTDAAIRLRDQGIVGKPPTA